MKKIISLALVALMAMTMIVAVSARDNTSIEVPYMSVKPTIDGVVNAGEWGTAIRVDSQNPQHTFGDDSGEGYNTADSIAFDLYFGWDETYFYIAMVTEENDDHVHTDTSLANIWNGDVFQFQIDPEGANSINGDPAGNDANGKAFPAGTPCFFFGLNSEDGSLAAWENATQNAGSVIGANYKIVNDTTAKTTTYEIAIPHTSIKSDNGIGTQGVSGYKCGVTVGRLSFTYDSPQWCDSWLTWGDGMCDPQPADLCGNNELVFVGGPSTGGDQGGDQGSGDLGGGNQDTGDNFAYIMMVVIAAVSVCGVVVTKKVRAYR